MQFDKHDHDYNDIVLDIRHFSEDFILPNRDAIHAVVDMNLQVRRGRITALVGESGSGKSAAALTVMGIEARNAAILGGQIFVDGLDVLAMSKKEKRGFLSCHAGIIFQDPVACLNPLITIEKQMIEGLLLHKKMSKKEAREIALARLRELYLPQPEEMLSKYPFMLSGGMCQRVGIAIASISNPSLLVADEPTTALDLTIQDQILRLMDYMRREGTIGILLITHDLSVVAQIADDVYVMREGRIVESGDVMNIFDNPQDRYTNSLLEAAL
jgi:ABC-type dipeptide/oligopeptide/nickel transport system ATPase component